MCLWYYFFFGEDEGDEDDDDAAFFPVVEPVCFSSSSSSSSLAAFNATFLFASVLSIGVDDEEEDRGAESTASVICPTNISTVFLSPSILVLNNSFRAFVCIALVPTRVDVVPSLYVASSVGERMRSTNTELAVFRR